MKNAFVERCSLREIALKARVPYQRLWSRVKVGSFPAAAHISKNLLRRYYTAAERDAYVKQLLSEKEGE